MRVISRLGAGIFAVALLFAGGAIFRLAGDNRRLAENSASADLAAHMENAYEKSFYEMSGHINSLEAGLSKVGAVSSPEVMHAELTELQVNSHAALCDLAALPFLPGSGEKISAYINQVRDFSAYLQRSLFESGSISAEDYEMLAQLHTISKSLSESIAQISKKIGAGTGFVHGGALDAETVNNLNRIIFDPGRNGFKYPEMVYDGRFADIRAKSVTVDLPLLTAERAAEKVSEQLDSLGVKAVRLVSEFNNRLPVYVFEVELNEGGSLLVQAAQNGGVIVFLSRSKNSEADRMQAVLSAEEAQTAAQKFAHDLGFEVEPVLISQTPGGVYYISLAPVKDGVVIYPDLVKAAIDSQGICGFESLNYLANHKEREIAQPQRTAAEAKRLLNKNLTVTDYKLALVRVRGKEILCWEFKCLKDDGMLSIFVGADSKSEIKILKQGELPGWLGFSTPS